MPGTRNGGWGLQLRSTDVMRSIFQKRPCYILFIFVAALAWSFLHATAQEAPAVPANGAAPPMTSEAAQAKLDEVQAALNLEEAVKTDLVARWTEVVEALQSAAAYANQATEFQSQIEQAPQRVEELQTRLAAPAADTDMEAYADADLAQLDQELATASAELAEARAQLTELESEPARRAARRKAIPEALAQARQRLDEVRTQLQATPGESTPQSEASRTLLAARQWSLTQEIKSYESELRFYDVASQLLTLRVDAAIRTVTQQEKLVKRLQDLIVDRRQTDARQAASEARQLRSQVQELSYFQEWAEAKREQNEMMARQRTGPDGLIARTDEIQEAVHAMEARVDAVVSDFTSVSERIDAVGLNNAVGMLLRKYLTDLPSLSVHRSNIKNREKTISELQLDLIQLREERREVADVEAAVADVLDHIPAEATDEERESVEEVLRELLRTTRDNLDALLTDTNTYFEALQNLDAAERELVAETAEFYSYIDERVLWIASGPPFTLEQARETLRGGLWLADPNLWLSLVRVLMRSVRQYALPYVLLVCGALLLALLRGRIRRRLADLGAKASKRSTTSIRPTIDATLLTILLVAPVPLLVWILGWILGATPSGTEFNVGVGEGLQRAAALLLWIVFVRQVAHAEGVATAHFGWPEGAVQSLRRHLIWFACVALPAVFLAAVAGHSDYKESLGRVLFVVMLGACAVFVWITFRPTNGALQVILESRRSKDYSHRMRAWWHVVFTALPVVLAGVALIGYFYTSQRLTTLFFFTVCLTTAILFVYGLILRWLMLARRAMAMEQARKRLAALKARDAEGDQPEVPIDEMEVDLAKVDVQTQRLVRSLLVLTFLVALWGIWAETLPALNILNGIELPWQRTESVTRTVIVNGESIEQNEDVEVPVTGVHVLAAILIVVMTVAATRNLPGLLEIAVLQRLSIGAGERYAITTVTRYVLAATGGVLAFQAIGIGWGNVQWLVAAVGLGLGFGLQEIFANFVSGLIILFERPIRVGDTVTVGGISGTVTRIRIRATTITDFDRKELVVPNKEFVTSQLVNWTLSSTTLRVVMPIGIAYGSDTRNAERILYELARNHADVMSDPGPEVWFTGFGESALKFELRVFSASLDTLLSIRHELLMQIDDAFKEAGIEIALPRQDVHVRSIEAILPVARHDSNPQDPVPLDPPIG